MTALTFSRRLAATLSLSLAALGSSWAATTVSVDVTGAQSQDLLGAAGNTVWLVNVGTSGPITALDWDVSLLANTPSQLADMQVSFGDSAGLDLLTLAPGIADAFSGSGHYAGSLDLSGLGLSVGADGLLRIEFSESFKDLLPGVADGQWTQGHLNFTVGTVPEPGGMAVVALGLGLSLVVRRRR